MSDEKTEISHYRALLVRQNEDRAAMLDRIMTGAYEYGALCVKNLILFNGAALVALPTFAGIREQQNSTLDEAAIAFAVGLALAVVTAYITHLNYLQNAMSNINEQYDCQINIYEIDVGNQKWMAEEKRRYQKAAEFHDRFVKVTFYAPHAIGILSLISFLAGCWFALPTITIE